MPNPPAAPEKMTLDRSEGSATLELYRAALGPLRADYYLKAFTRFDAAGKSGRSWNWEAALISLNWMLYRKLWTVALSYVGAVTAATLLLFGIGRLVFQLSQETQWVLLLAGVLLAIAVPGAYGNAWLYAACNRKMERALVASSTLEDACALLTRDAGGVPRMVSLAGLNLALCLAVAALMQSCPAPDAMPAHSGPVAPAHAVVGLVQGSLTAQAPVKPALAPALTASAPQAVASQAAPTPLAPLAPPAEQAAPQEAAKKAPETVEAKPAPAPTEEKAVPAKAAKKSKLTKAERLAKAKADKAEKAAAKAAKKEAANTAAAETGKFLINVGLFADANNARNAYVKLQDAGLPALSQEVTSSKGPRTRVRVGPFESQPEADRAAERIRALKLDAAIFKQ
jgi:cell division protein FtsN